MPEEHETGSVSLIERRSTHHRDAPSYGAVIEYLIAALVAAGVALPLIFIAEL